MTIRAISTSRSPTSSRRSEPSRSAGVPAASSAARRVERQVELQHVDARLAEEAEAAGPRCAARSAAAPAAAAGCAPSRRAPPGTCAPATLMCGSRPLPEAVTRSTGTGAVLPGSAARSASMRPLTASVSAGFSGPWFEPLEALALLGIGPVADGRPQTYFGSLKFCPISDEPTGLPSRRIRLPAACSGNGDLADAGDDQRVGDAGQRGQHHERDEGRTNDGVSCRDPFRRGARRRAAGRSA